MNIPQANPSASHLSREFVMDYSGHQILASGQSIHGQPSQALEAQFSACLPQTEKIVQEILSLPLYPELTDSQVDVVIHAIRDFEIKSRSNAA